jgi:glycosyltransferase involved in cell wall biosynthesis
MAKKKKKTEDQDVQDVLIPDGSINETFVEGSVEKELPIVTKEKPLINIIVRTHNRPKYFLKCLRSIMATCYNPRIVHVIVDNNESLKYAQTAVQNGMANSVSMANANFTDNRFGSFAELKALGICKNNSDEKKHRYDLYLNDKLRDIEQGWIFFLDDDKEITSSRTLDNISERLTEDDIMLVGQHRMKSRLLPDGDLWGVLPFKRAHIDMSCFIFNVKHKELCHFDGHGAGDWRTAKRMAEVLRVEWLREPFTTADNDGNSGKAEK